MFSISAFARRRRSRKCLSAWHIAAAPPRVAGNPRTSALASLGIARSAACGLHSAAPGPYDAGANLGITSAVGRVRHTVGLRWAGRVGHRNDHIRSLPCRRVGAPRRFDVDFGSLHIDERAPRGRTTRSCVQGLRGHRDSSRGSRPTRTSSDSTSPRSATSFSPPAKSSNRSRTCGVGALGAPPALNLVDHHYRHRHGGPSGRIAPLSLFNPGALPRTRPTSRVVVVDVFAPADRRLARLGLAAHGLLPRCPGATDLRATPGAGVPGLCIAAFGDWALRDGDPAPGPWRSLEAVDVATLGWDSPSSHRLLTVKRLRRLSNQMSEQWAPGART